MHLLRTNSITVLMTTLHGLILCLSSGDGADLAASADKSRNGSRFGAIIIASEGDVELLEAIQKSAKLQIHSAAQQAGVEY